MASTTLGDLLAAVGAAGRVLTARSGTPERSLAEQCEALLGGAGEATGLAIAADILDGYAKLDAEGRLRFFEMLAGGFGVDRSALDAAMRDWQAGAVSDARALHAVTEPRSQELLRRLNRAHGATAALVAMRADLLVAMRQAPGLAGLDGDFRHLFGSWFNRGFLELRHIDWSTPAAILERIIAYEAVHEVQGWDDLRRRVAAPDRRLYAFFHPALRDDPLIFVEVALTAEAPAAIGPILAENRTPLDPAEATTATFYSISNCQKGLRGISFGNFLIKQVVEDLRREFSNLRHFVTLSPVPGFRRWAIAEAAKPDSLLTAEEVATVAALEAGSVEGNDAVANLAARYFLTAQAPKGGPVDPVARFHLGNGAQLDRLNLAGDLSANGAEAAWGLMVNYRYDLASIERNHESFAANGTVIASPGVRRLLKSKKTGDKAHV